MLQHLSHTPCLPRESCPMEITQTLTAEVFNTDSSTCEWQSLHLLHGLPILWLRKQSKLCYLLSSPNSAACTLRMLRRQLSKSIFSSLSHHSQQLLQEHYSNHSKYDTDHKSEPLQRVVFARTKHTAHRACNLVSRKCQRCFQFFL